MDLLGFEELGLGQHLIFQFLSCFLDFAAERCTDFALNFEHLNEVIFLLIVTLHNTLKMQNHFFVFDDARFEPVNGFPK